VKRVVGERDAAVAGVAHRPAAVAAGERVQPGAVPEVDVLDEPGLLQRVEVAVDGAEVGRRQRAVQTAGHGLGAHRPFGRVERLEHEAAGSGDPQAAGAQGAHGGSGG
jgi:hypothetical protein